MMRIKNIKSILKIDKNKMISVSLSLTFLSVFAALMIPYKFPLFPILIFINLLIVIFNLSKTTFYYRKNSLIYFYGLYLVLYFISIIFFSFQIFEFFIPDLRNAITCSLLLFTSIVLIKDMNHLKQILWMLYKQLFIVSLVSSMLGLFKFYLMLNGTFIDFLRLSDGSYPLGTSLLNDYNTYSFGLFMGLIIGFGFLKTNITPLKRMMLWISIITLLITISMTGSRRSLLILGVFVLFFLISEFRNYLKLITKTLLTLRGDIRLLRPIFGILFVFTITFFFVKKSNFEFSDLSQVEKILIRVESLGDASGSFNERTKRWHLSNEIFTSMNLKGLLFGNGYNYWVDFVPNRQDKLGTDYPHNIFMSIFFSNGIIGVFLISGLLIISFIVYLKNMKLLFPLLVGYSISFIYLFISGDQIFSNKAIVLLIFIPIIFETKKQIKT
jgi:hypothetical protein